MYGYSYSNTKRTWMNEYGVLLDIENAPPKTSSQLWCTSLTDCVSLRVVKDGDGLSSSSPLTVHTFLANAVKRWPSKNAMAYKSRQDLNVWLYITYEEYYRLACALAKAFIKLGLEERRSVCILGFNSPCWFIANMAAIFAGGVSCGIYTTNSPEACQHILDDSGAQIVLVENIQQLKRILSVRDKLPSLKSIIIWDPEVDGSYNSDVLKWDAALELGESEENLELMNRIRSLVPNECCCLIYTSGTTGDPKGVMLSHDNLTWTTMWMGRYCDFSLGTEERLVSYLPLSHVAAQISDLYSSINIACCVYFAQPDAFRGSLRTTLCEVRPTLLPAVPRVFEKMHEKMKEVGASMGWLAQYVSSWAKSIGYAGAMASLKGSPKPWGWSTAYYLVLYRAKYALGLDKCRMLASVAAPLNKDTMEYFLSLDMAINQVYGMSESSGPQTYNKAGANRLLSVGLCPPGSQIKLHNLDEDGEGEICMFGRNVFMGYLKSIEKTKETMDEDGWLHSGDIGIIDKDGYLFITGRMKEIIITAGGENVAPVPIEDRIREVLPCVSQAMLVGDKQKFLSVLLTLKTHVDSVSNEPLDELLPVAKTWCQQHNNGMEIHTLSELCASLPTGIKSGIEEAIQLVNSRSVSHAARIQKFMILPRDFSIAGGELGPTMKLRRAVVSKLYQSEIEQLYA